MYMRGAQQDRIVPPRLQASTWGPTVVSSVRCRLPLRSGMPQPPPPPRRFLLHRRAQNL